jgi:hypothetical protein
MDGMDDMDDMDKIGWRHGSDRPSVRDPKSEISA